MSSSIGQPAIINDQSLTICHFRVNDSGIRKCLKDRFIDNPAVVQQ